MRLSSMARRLPDEVWAAFEPILPPVAWAGEGRPPASNHAVLHGLLYVLITGIGWEYVPPCFPCGRTIKARLDRWLEVDAFRTAWQRLAERYAELHGVNWDKVLLDGSIEAVKKGGALTGPNPTDRAKSGTAIHLATEEHGLPLGVAVTGANANDGVQTKDVLDALVIRPPAPDRPHPTPEPRDLPRVRADGAYGNGPTRQRATDAGFRMLAPGRGQTRRPGIWRVRCAVERGHAFLSQFDRIARRLDRNAKRYLG